MKARWQAVEARFAALQRREKIMIAAAATVGVLLLGFDIWVDPANSRVAKLQSEVAKDKAAVQTGQVDIMTLTARIADRDAPTKAALADVKSQLAVVDGELQEYERVLVPPGRVQELLRSVLAKHRGLELISLQTLQPAPLVDPAKSADQAAVQASQPAVPNEPKKTDGKETAAKNDSIHKQGLEIRIVGNYLDLLSYVSDLERLPQKLLWGSMSLKVTTYPNSELTLTVYSLSPDSRWLVL